MALASREILYWDCHNQLDLVFFFNLYFEIDFVHIKKNIYSFFGAVVGKHPVAFQHVCVGICEIK